jgi:hypothetical protein
MRKSSSFCGGLFFCMGEYTVDIGKLSKTEARYAKINSTPRAGFSLACIMRAR